MVAVQVKTIQVGSDCHCTASQRVVLFQLPGLGLLMYMYMYMNWMHVMLQWNPYIVDTWGPGEVSYIHVHVERCPHFRGKFPLRKHIWDTVKCP